MFLGSSPFGYIFTQAKNTEAKAAATATLTSPSVRDLLIRKNRRLVSAGVESASLLDGISAGKHPLMEDASDHNALGIGPLEEEIELGEIGVK